MTRDPMSDTNTKQKKSRVIVAALLATTILGGGLALRASPAFSAGDAQPPLNAPTTAPAVANPGGFADLVARVKPAVVNIQATLNPNRPMAMGEQRQAPQERQQMPPGM